MARSDPEIRNRFGEIANAYRTQLRLSSRKMAERMGISYQLIYLVETDKAGLTLKILKGYVDVFREEGLKKEEIDRLVEAAVDVFHTIDVRLIPNKQDRLRLIRQALKLASSTEKED